jgi:hypothetical protein
VTKAQILAANFGGRWTYDGMASWHCDDEKRFVSRCSRGVDQFDDPLPGCDYVLYGDGRPHYINDLMQYGKGVSLCKL